MLISCDFIIQIPLNFYIILLWSILFKTIIWDSTLVHLIILSSYITNLLDFIGLREI
jgi:hypothetical protein